MAARRALPADDDERLAVGRERDGAREPVGERDHLGARLHVGGVDDVDGRAAGRGPARTGIAVKASFAPSAPQRRAQDVGVGIRQLADVAGLEVEHVQLHPHAADEAHAVDLVAERVGDDRVAAPALRGRRRASPSAASTSTGRDEGDAGAVGAPHAEHRPRSAGWCAASARRRRAGGSTAARRAGTRGCCRPARRPGVLSAVPWVRRRAAPAASVSQMDSTGLSASRSLPRTT